MSESVHYSLDIRQSILIIIDYNFNEIMKKYYGRN